ncbi:MAG: hypothetical protein LUG27_00255 [Clostridiales bacterium]|nr:hypothetical protein [Clostridiales bacterium]
MRLITFAGPPSSGKTSVIIQTILHLKKSGFSSGVVKFDCLTSFDRERYQQHGIPACVGYAGKICPDHFFVSNIEEAVEWGQASGFDFLFTESAGLCNRCSPYIRAVPAVCVIDSLAGIQTPKKVGPMLKSADVAVITKSDIVSQAEREVFAFNISQVNPNARVLFVNGITGQGILPLAGYIRQTAETDTVRDMKLRFTTPSSICSYCTGETRIGESHQLGTMKKMEFY